MNDNLFLRSLFFIILGILFCFLLIYKLSSHMIFFSDVGWFYMQARDMLLTGNIPLVSIPTSHPWLHQGPYWTYALGLSLFFGKFNPLSGGILAIVISIATLCAFYFCVRNLFGQTVAMIASLLYISSPLIIIHSRMPYHTTPIPFFTLLYVFSLYLWIKNGNKYFPLIIFSLAALYNFELATVILFFHFLVFLLTVRIFNSEIIKKLFNVRTIVISMIAFLIPMIPMILYDLSHGYPQTIKFVVWLFYRAYHVITSIFQSHIQSQNGEFIAFSATLLQRLLFQPNLLIALLLFIAAIIYSLTILITFKKTKIIDQRFIISSASIVAIIGYLGNRVTSEAYLPMLFPLIIISLALTLNALNKGKFQRYFLWIGLVIIVSMNIRGLLIHNYFMEVEKGYGTTLLTRTQAVKSILSQAQGKPYNIKGIGEGSQFESYLKPYTYLGWYYGNEPKGSVKDPVFTIKESEKAVTIKRMSL